MEILEKLFIIGFAIFLMGGGGTVMICGIVLCYKFITNGL